MIRFKSKIVIVLASLVVCIVQVRAETITVAVASNFSVVLEELIQDFESLNRASKIVLVSGSSGKLYAQIKHGAPFDLFMSADQDKPIKLIEEGLAIAESRFTYAVGSLVLWSADSKRIDNSSSVLENLEFNKLALANSKLAPYGWAAENVLNQLNLLNSSHSKWVQGENIAQTYQFVETRNADIGFIAKSQVWKNGSLKSGSVWLIPHKLYTPIKQDAVLLKASRNSELAKKMMHFLQTPEVSLKIESFGYQAQSN